MNNLNRNVYICQLIVPVQKALKVESLLRKYNAGFVLNQQCKGTVDQRILHALGIHDSSRVMIQGMISEKKLEGFLQDARNKLKLDEEGQGICLVKKLNKLYISQTVCKPESEDNQMSNKVLITAITNYGKTDELIKVARENGARGATILKGHGTVSEDAKTFFGFPIEPEKEVILLIVPREIEDQVMKAIHTAGNFEEENYGIVFSQELSQTLGISS